MGHNSSVAASFKPEQRKQLNRVYFETRSFQKGQYFELETLNSWLLAPDSFVSKLQFSIWTRFKSPKKGQ